MTRTSQPMETWERAGIRTRWTGDAGRRGQCPRSSAFTLIELLIVISIVAVLAGMLMPAVSMVQSMARKTQCGAHLRQWHLAVLTYGNDNEGFLPAARLGWSQSQYWYATQAEVMGDNWMQTYKSTGSVVSCRALRQAGKDYNPSTPGNAAMIYVSYSMNVGLAYTHGIFWAEKWTPMASIRSQCETSMWGELSAFGYYNYSAPFANPHQQRGNFMFCDGHLASLSALQTPTLASSIFYNGGVCSNNTP